tara:strand:+ start:911 stop:1090 length:180 start_codon:yes stop_codon:yes gene_type:complete
MHLIQNNALAEVIDGLEKALKLTDDLQHGGSWEKHELVAEYVQHAITLLPNPSSWVKEK